MPSVKMPRYLYIGCISWMNTKDYTKEMMREKDGRIHPIHLNVYLSGILIY